MLKRLLVFGVVGLLSFGAAATDIPTEKMTLRGVDKVTGHVKTFVATVGQSLTFGTLTVLPEKCVAHPPEETPENAAFLTITEKTAEGALVPVFNGWMFSSNPALSAMEHPIYDIWVLNCLTDWHMSATGGAGAVVPELSEEELRAINEEDNPSLGEDVSVEMPIQSPADER